MTEALKRLGGEHGIDVIYDPVGGPCSEAALRAIAWEGRFLVIGFAAGEIPKLPLNLTLLKGCDIRGVNWGAFVRQKPQAHRTGLDQLARWCAQGKLSCHIHAVYPLAETAQALKAIARAQGHGQGDLAPVIHAPPPPAKSSRTRATTPSQSPGSLCR